MARKAKIESVHQHVLLWNLRASRDNAVHAPEGSGWRETAPKLIAKYEAEFARRGLPVPALDTTEEQWEVLLAKALQPTAATG